MPKVEEPKAITTRRLRIFGLIFSGLFSASFRGRCAPQVYGMVQLTAMPLTAYNDGKGGGLTA